MKLHKYSLEELKQAINESASLRQVLIKLKAAPFGGNYETLKKAIKHFNLDVSHFSGQAWNKGKKLSPKYSLADYFENKVPIHSYKLKNRILENKRLKPVCSSCNNDKWLGKPVPLELDHINGNNKDNRFENLRLLCPNCHALTPTYRGKNRSKA
jgi:5-methylcytosine-specific restriction endonuclease McrA